ncbi:hypothetical protein F4818DRAFT_377115 [Hypoxylon cercidicola]|nr:hypothetical protein F4818DRAFT_377115 [Hypoxylon cercidicola]
MDGSPAFFSNSIQDGEDGGDELFDTQHVNMQSGDRQDARLVGPFLDTSPERSHLTDPLSINSIYIQTADKHTRNQFATSQSDYAKLISPSLSSGSSETPDTRSSQQTATPKDAPTNTDDKRHHASVADGFPPPGCLRTKGRRQRKQRAEEDVNHALDMDVSKRNRFLEKNRMAATKCRQKKKEWVSDLEETRFGLESQNNHLQMEYSNLRSEITHIKSQLMEHANCNDPNINKWIENEAKKFVMGAGERYDQILANLGPASGLIARHESFSSTSGYPAGLGSELLSPVTPSHRDSISFPTGPVFYRPDLSMADATTSDRVEETYRPPTSFDGVPMADDMLPDSVTSGG